jgi:glycosyltransferase involved in cell wall biosynthesis
MRFSIIMPSLLADYPGSATGKDQKIVRAVESVLMQSFKDWELIVILDGCDLTEWIIKKFTDKRIKLFRVERNGLFSNDARNKGIEEAKGDYIIYLDADDIWGVDHLKIFAENLKKYDWIYSNDWTHYGEDWQERICDVEQFEHCGTSNICHSRKLGVKWIQTGYGHDYYFIQQLLEFPNYSQIPTAQYYVCHVGHSYQI